MCIISKVQIRPLISQSAITLPSSNVYWETIRALVRFNRGRTASHMEGQRWRDPRTRVPRFNLDSSFIVLNDSFSWCFVLHSVLYFLFVFHCSLFIVHQIYRQWCHLCGKYCLLLFYFLLPLISIRRSFKRSESVSKVKTNNKSWTIP